MSAYFGNIYIDGEGIRKSRVEVQNGKIVGFGSESEGAEILPEGQILVPGFIDKHIHGAGGADCMTDSAQSVRRMSEVLPQEGVTRFLPTTMTASIEQTERAVREISSVCGATEGAEAVGIHLEGPFLSPKKAGAQPKEDICVWSEDKLDRICSPYVKQMTFAPERNHGLIAELNKRGIVPSVGHTDATAEEVLLAEKAGAKSITHMYNAMSAISHRDCGAAGGALLSNLWIELICDGRHVGSPAVRLLHKTVPKQVILVTDSTEAKYLPDGKYRLGKNEIFVSDGIALLRDGTIAGSVLKMNEAIYKYKTFCNIDLTEAIDAASVRPAKCLGIDGVCGSIAVGKDADFAVIDEKCTVYQTVRRGKIIYKKQ